MHRKFEVDRTYGYIIIPSGFWKFDFLWFFHQIAIIRAKIGVWISLDIRGRIEFVSLSSKYGYKQGMTLYSLVCFF